jgi:hypothetical protein
VTKPFNYDWNATVWTGSFSLGELGTPTTTCEDWTSTAAEYWGLLGASDGTLDGRWWSGSGAQMCAGPGADVPYRIYCIEP